MVLLDDGTFYNRSDAALRVLRGLGPIWAVVGGLALLIPRQLRDAIYSAVAKRRRRWFGGAATCERQSANDTARFLP
jgi:predicted DCC family thiol-disulfide oxidoreductase YuxK